MTRGISIIFIFLILLAAGCYAAPAAQELGDATDAERYDCRLELTPAMGMAADSPLTVTLEIGAKRNTRLTLTTRLLTVESITGGTSHRVAQVESGVTPGAACRLTVLRREGWLGVMLDERMLFHGDVPRGDGGKAEYTAGAGWGVVEARVQPREAVVFADNFMRTAEENGDWTIRGGAWALQSAWDRDPKGGSLKFQNARFAQNPFAWVGRATDGPALCLAGQPFWDDYTFSVAVCPPDDGAVGVAVNVAAPDRYLLVRWTPAPDRGPDGDTLSLARVEGGKRTVLASARGGYLPRQWYRLSVVSSPDGVRVLIDGRERLVADDVIPRRGGVAASLKWWKLCEPLRAPELSFAVTRRSPSFVH